MHKTVKKGCRAIGPMVFVLFLSKDALAAGQSPHRFSVGTGFDYSNGDYGDVVDTEIWYVPFRLRYEYDRWTARLTVPWLQITGPGNVAGGGEDITVLRSGARVARTTESGLGDVSASLSYLFTPGRSFPDIEVTGKVKFPTADEDRGLGTGEFDYTIQAEAYKTFGAFTPSALAGYKFKGDPTGSDLNDVFLAGVAGDYRVNDWWSVGATFDFQEATSDTSDDSLDLGGYVSWKVHPKWIVTGYGGVGLSDGSPDENVGVSIRYKFY